MGIVKQGVFAFLTVGFVCFVFSINAYADQAGVPSPPIPFDSKLQMQPLGKVGNGNSEIPGQWYKGDTPTNLKADTPVLVFVPGLNNTAQIWWEDNDMYQTAYDAGYQTAFVQLHDAGGASADMWDNGALLAEMIEEISAAFAGKPLVIIAYSKGGVDTQTALAHYEAWKYVDRVITLSSPHHGSQLADLAYSSWAGWLTDLIGAKGDGTYSMQMGFMEEFRTQMDNHPYAYVNPYYTLAGTSWGNVFSSTWFGGVYLSRYGANDGVVTVHSSRLMDGEEIAIGEWTHKTIRTGMMFPIFEAYLSLNRQIRNQSIDKAVGMPTTSYNQWVYGGPVTEGVDKIDFAVEEKVQQVALQLMTTRPLEQLTLTDPLGNIYEPTVQSTSLTEGVFKGAFNHAITLPRPKAGEWTIHIKTEKRGAYLLVAQYESPLNDAFHVARGKRQGLQMNYQLSMRTDQIQADKVKAVYRITDTNHPENTKTYTIHGKTDLSQQLEFTKSNTVYNITIDLEGITKAGASFTRTIIDSVYVQE